MASVRYIDVEKPSEKTLAEEIVVTFAAASRTLAPNPVPRAPKPVVARTLAHSAEVKTSLPTMVQPPFLQYTDVDVLLHFLKALMPL